MMGDSLVPGSLAPELFETITRGLGEHSKHTTANFGGVAGDFASHPHIMEIVDTALDHYNDVFMETNGGARSEKWWKELAELGQGRPMTVRFSIDGLADTNVLYRINTEFDRIMSNARAFIDAGGEAQWKYIIFDHNQHQVEQARDLARDMGFRKFTTVVSNRFFRPDNVFEIKSDSYKAKINKVGEQVRQQGFELKPGKKSDAEKMKQMGRTWQELDSDQDVQIECRTKQDGYLYVDHGGKLWPCCHWATQNERQTNHRRWLYWQQKFEDMYGKDFNQLGENRTVLDLLKHDLLTTWLPDSFSGQHDKCTVCIASCTAKKNARNTIETERL